MINCACIFVGHDFDKAAEELFDKMIMGNLDKIPDLPQSVVRVFISSTFSGMLLHSWMST